MPMLIILVGLALVFSCAALALSVYAVIDATRKG
jgi:hypothetical protein